MGGRDGGGVAGGGVAGHDREMTRAVVATGFGGPDLLRVMDVDVPPPGPGQVLLHVHAAGVNPADWKSYSGLWGTDPERLPMRLGFEAAGVVAAVGPDVDGVAVGDEVIANPASGAYADRILVAAGSLMPKPPSMTWPEAGGLMVVGTTAAHTVTATKVGAGDTVLVHGASGSVGSMVVQLARARGARVIGTAAPANHEYLIDLGATPVTYGPGLLDRVRAASSGPIDAAIDTSGTNEALDVSVALVADRRRVATIAGFGHGAVLGVQLLGGGARADPGTEIRRAARATLLRLWEAGRLHLRVGATVPLVDAARAHRIGMEHRVHGKIVILPDPAHR